MVVYGFTVSHLLSFKGLEKPTRYGCVPLNVFFPFALLLSLTFFSGKNQ